MAVKDRDEFTGTETTQHEWDGIQELDTPLPRWWLWTFYLTIIWGIGYTIAYPAWPMISEATRGVLGYSSRAEVAADIAAQKKARAGTMAKIEKAGFKEIAADKTLSDFAKSGGAAIFRTNCAQCHGAGGGGALSYPNLIDDDWLWDGSAKGIAYTIRHGIRWEADDDTRTSAMPAFGTDGTLDAAEIKAVASHVLSLTKKAKPDKAGAEIYKENCASCHGAGGKGNKALGAPNLADAIWLFGGDLKSVIATITSPRNGIMPAWKGRLTEAEIKQVTHYIRTRGQ